MGVRMQRLLRELQLEPLSILPYKPQDEPTWRLQPSLCNDLLSIKKSDYSALELKYIFLDHISSCHSNSYHIYTDGSSSDDGSGAGVFCDTLSRSMKLSPMASSFTAEMYAVLEALTHISNMDIPSSVIFTDSRSTIQLLSTPHSTNPLVCAIQAHLLRLPNRVEFCWVPAHVGVPGNEQADTLAGAAASSDGPVVRAMVPYRDYYRSIRQSIYRMWQEEWANVPSTNKLRSYRESISPWYSSSQATRRHEVLLTRLRIGHSLLTHGYLMRGEQYPPYCQNCLVPLSVRHLLVECPDYLEERHRFFGPHPTLRTLLGEPSHGSFNLTRLLHYLAAINYLEDL